MKERFPADFRFGVADADLQVIGEEKARASEKSEETMWSHFARTSGKCFNDMGPGEGVDRFSLWERDVELMRELGVRNYRTSISMSRLLTRSGDINAKAVQWYENYFKALRKSGITIYATLYHWELPQFLNEQGGWKNRVMVDWLAKHAQAVFETLGEHIEEYFILNEPWCSAMLGYHLGIHAPGEISLSSGFLAAHNLLLAQGAAFEKLKSLDRSLKVSTVVNLASCYAASASEQDERAARHADAYFNTWFLEPMFNGRYPDEAREIYAGKMPHYGKADMALINIGSGLHALGINYYRGELVRYDERAETRFAAVRRDGEQTNDLGWPIYVPPVHPEGLYDLLQQVWFSYRASGLKRIYITENGMAQASSSVSKNGVFEDARRVEYLRAHLEQAAAAVQRGIPLKAYFAWTLMDNYEWQEGYRPESCFGLVHVDRQTMKRTKKESAVWYSNVMKGGTVAPRVIVEREPLRHSIPVTQRPHAQPETPAAVLSVSPTHILRKKFQPQPAEVTAAPVATAAPIPKAAAKTAPTGTKKAPGKTAKKSKAKPAKKGSKRR
ncbi:MAG: family 1 glycosylhydrolase [Deltaproteobacteria bacterium]|nr:family 1 glycosylhydrolase [Deltaproteobacteria bacterium]